jgi:hypothetical protein
MFNASAKDLEEGVRNKKIIQEDKCCQKLLKQ